jgi:hypothetical protein
MIRKFIVLVGCSVLAACVSSADQSSALKRLQAACDGGDTAACQTVVDIEQRERQRVTDMWFGDDVVFVN